MSKILRSPFFGAFLGFLSFSLLFDLRILNPNYIDFLLGKGTQYTSNDTAQHFFGWWFFRDTPWQFPLGTIDHYFSGLQSNLAYTDSIPWLGVLLKFLLPHEILPQQYFGWWFAISYTLMGLTAVLFMRQRTGNLLAILGGTLFMVTAPPLVFRTGHMALCAHWILLATFTWMESFHTKPTSILRWTGILLPTFATLTHPYIGAMVLTGVILVFLFQEHVTHRIQDNLKMLCILTLGLFVFGYLPTPQINKVNDFGSLWWSADVFSFFLSMGKSSFFPSPKSWGGHYEGFAFLGAGGLFLFLLWAIKSIKQIHNKQISFPWKKWVQNPIYLTLIVLTAYAFSAHMRFFGFWIISLEWLFNPFEKITIMFRSSGRFLWPLYYYFMRHLWVYAIDTAKTIRIQRRIFFGAIALQILCQFSVWKQDRFGPGIQQAQLSQFSQQFSETKEIKIIPPFINYQTCQNIIGEGYLWHYPAYAAGLYKIPINSGSIANIDDSLAQKQCENEMKAFHQKPDKDVAYLFQSQWLESHKPNLQNFNCNSWLADWKICKFRDTNLSAKQSKTGDNLDL